MKTLIVSVPAWPSVANTLYIRAVSFGADGPTYFYELQRVTETAPAVPAVPATDDAPEVPAVPAVFETLSLVNGNFSMTKAQWDSWAEDADDDQYQLDCACKTLGLTRVLELTLAG